MHVLLIVLNVTNSMIGKTTSPDLKVRSRLIFRLIRETTLDELNRSLKGNQWRDEQMKVIRHQNEFVEEKRIASV
jgi:post-segregation antitoxin (ccd killing protein)